MRNLNRWLYPTFAATCRAPPRHPRSRPRSSSSFAKLSAVNLDGHYCAREVDGIPDAKTPQTPTMINAFLVFNGSGQPRLTKFYTQIASAFRKPPTAPIARG